MVEVAWYVPYMYFILVNWWLIIGHLLFPMIDKKIQPIPTTTIFKIHKIQHFCDYLWDMTFLNNTLSSA